MGSKSCSLPVFRYGVANDLFVGIATTKGRIEHSQSADEVWKLTECPKGALLSLADEQGVYTAPVSRDSENVLANVGIDKRLLSPR